MPMSSFCTPYTRVPHSSTLLVDYLYHFDRLARFFSGSPYEASSYKSVAGRLKDLQLPRSELVEVLKRQNQAFGSSEAAFANIRRLSDPGTYAVLTGQQVGLFSGPAFTLYKALTAVRLAQSLSEQGIPSVPVFWLATEDHDLEEVASCAAFDEDYNLVELADGGERPAPRAPVAQARLTGAARAAIERLESALPAGEARDQLIHDLRETHPPGSTWGEAFGRFTARLFSARGVVLLDPFDEPIHSLNRRVYQAALRHAADWRARLLERTQELVRYGYHAQVHVAEDSTLIFATAEGNRVPVHLSDGQFSLDNAERTSLERLEAGLAERPLEFSANVLLRPVVQDMLLPTVAYVAGPSELAYLGQAQVIYAALGRPQPVVFPRAGFTLVDGRTQRLLEKYRLSVEDVWQGEEHVQHKIAAAAFSQGWSENLDQSEQDLERLLGRLRRDIEQIDPTLLDALKHAEEKMRYQMERMRGKLSRAALQRSEVLARHQQALMRFLLPHKDLQERRVGGIYFLGRAGYSLLERIYAQIQTHCSDHQILIY